jgi:hypothetical protein
MKDVHEAVAFARAHFHSALVGSPKLPLEEYRLHPSLQYDLCTAFSRIMETLGEVTRRDVVMICECWLSARRVVYGDVRPIESKGTPLGTRSLFRYIADGIERETRGR